jgi:hypothetical protein
MALTIRGSEGRSAWSKPGTLETQLERWLPTDELRHQVLVTNPDRLYFC